MKHAQIDYKRNEDIIKELKIELILDIISKYRNNRIQHVNRVQRDGFPKCATKLKTRGTKKLIKTSEESSESLGLG
jgi:hypothetical protein